MFTKLSELPPSVSQFDSPTFSIGRANGKLWHHNFIKTHANNKGCISKIKFVNVGWNSWINKTTKTSVSLSKSLMGANFCVGGRFSTNSCSLEIQHSTWGHLKYLSGCIIIFSVIFANRMPSVNIYLPLYVSISPSINLSLHLSINVSICIQ